MKSLRLVAAVAAACFAMAGPALGGTTTYLGCTYPTVGGDDSAWGAIINSAFQCFDSEWRAETLGDASLSAASATRIIRLTTAFTAPRTITLPAASTHTPEQPLIVFDPIGAVGATNTLTFARAGSDTIESPSAAAGTSYVVASPRRAVMLRSDGTSKWTVGSDLGTLAKQDASAVAITGGGLSGVTLSSSALGTPTSATLTNATGLPISTGISGLGTGVAAFLATPSSANLASAVTGETGSGAAVFGTSPTIDTPTLNGTPTLGSASGWRTALGVTAIGADATYAFRANNLSDLANLATARSNLGLGSGSSPTFAGLAATGDTALGDGNSDTATVTGHLASSGSTPTVSSCGTSPSVGAGANDQRGYVTNGGGTVVVCTVNFSRAFANPPICTLSINSNSPVVIAGFNGPPSTTGFAASFGSNYAGGGWFYLCLG